MFYPRRYFQHPPVATKLRFQAENDRRRKDAEDMERKDEKKIMHLIKNHDK